MDSCDLSTPKRRKSEAGEQSSPAADITKRKSPSKFTPRKRASKSSTPKKNSPPKKNGSVVASCVLAQKIDLWQEAKLSAEEDSRIYAGRKIHPFFTLWKADKEKQLKERAAKRKIGRTTCGPIHVFENVQDDVSPLDWSGWTFLDKTTVADFGTESSNLSVMEGSVESLNFDNLLSALRPSSASISHKAMSCPSQLPIQPDSMLEISPPNSYLLSNEQVICPSKPEEAKVDLDLEVNENTFSGHKGIFRKSDTEPLSKFIQESMRSYYHGCEGKAASSLWIHKYKPTKAFEVCGNEEAVDILRNWLHLWHERHYLCRKVSCNRNQNDRLDDDDYICSDTLEDTDEEDALQKVLLITGPIGSGKSAAVYACAQEQGFEVLELNASEFRNGAAIKEHYESALEARQFKRLLDRPKSSQKKTVKLLPAPALPNGIADEEMDDGVIELIAMSDNEVHSLGGTSPMLHGKSNALICDSVPTLILIEDLDILFSEDRGYITAIKHISKTAKWPIILTSNSNNGGLPNNFARLHVSFSLPLPDELLSHMYMVCVTEEADINPILLNKFVQSCDGDIRKTIMQLQFWFQSSKYRKDRRVQKVYDSVPFDIEACHQIMPNILPWNYPSELSKLIEMEVAKSITIMEENSCMQGLVNKELDINERKNYLDVQSMMFDSIEAKLERISRSLTDCGECGTQRSAISELSNCSGSLVTSSWQKGESRLIVMSSSSGEKDPNNGHSLVCSGLEDSEEERHKYVKNAYDACLNEKHKSYDFTCVPGSISIPETAIQNGIKQMSGPVSSGCHAGLVQVSLNNELKPFTSGVSQFLDKLAQNSDSFTNTEIPETSSKATMQNFRDRNMETTTVCTVIDECSHADFKFKSKFVDYCPSMAMDMVRNLWKKLRICGKDLGQHVNPEQLGVIKVVKLTSGLTNLISEADILFHKRQLKQCGIMEPPMFLSDEAMFSWYEEQMMMSTFAVHGFCFYAKHISDVGCKNVVDLTSEILACTNNVMSLGKLSRQDQTKSTSIYAKKQLEFNNPTNDTKRTSLSNVIRSITPARSSLAMKGLAFNEYISSLRQISISECFRISHGSGKMRKRRRVAPHYLTRGRMSLSSEDISLVCEGDLYTKISSQYTANVEINCT